MKTRPVVCYAFLAMTILPVALRAQPAREACAEAARALVRQSTSWESGRYGGDTLRWRAANGALGFCRVDARGRVFEVTVERWGSEVDVWLPPGGGGGAGLTEERGYDRRGDDYTSFGARALGDCTSACRRDDRCRAYTYSARDSRCWLKSRVNSPQAAYGMITGFKSAASAGVTEEAGLDRRGNDYSSFRASGLADCKETCLRDGRCRAYTFDTRNGACFLKDRVNSAQRDGGMVTGYKLD
jgi:hypothetical protein